MCSVRTFSAFSPSDYLRRHGIPNYRLKSPSLTSSVRHTQKPPTLPFQQRSFKGISLNPFQYHTLHKPTSEIAHVKNTFPFPLRNFVKFLAQKAVIFIIGTFFFMSFRCPKPCLAQPSRVVSSKTENEDEEMLEKLLEREPRNVEAIKVALYRKMRSGKMEEAVKHVEKLINIQPQEVEWKLLQALCYEMLGQLSKAKRLFKKILRDKPLLVKALHGLAMVMHKNHEGPAVFEMLNEALGVARREKRVTEERNIRILIGQMLIVKGQLEEGLKVFQEMIDENPRDFRPYLCQGIIYSLMDRKEEAAKQMEIYWSLVPEEFPERGFLDDVLLAAETKSRQQQKQSQAKYRNKVYR